MKGAKEILLSSKTPELKTITGADLMRLELPELPAVVPGFIVEGLTLLASRPKLGKSWLMLAVALEVASGGHALGKIRVEQAEALYLGLEDNERRLQSRLEIITNTVPDGLHLATSGSMSRLDKGGLDQLGAWLTEHPACRLVVIDTLARVKTQSRPGANMYDEDAALGTQLQELAIKHKIALVLVHHVRKALAEDFLDTVSGSTGLTGIADAVLVLTRQRGAADAVLHVTGRDIEEDSHALQFDPKRGLWSLLGDASIYALTSERQAILTYLAKSGEPVSPKKIAEDTGLPRGSTRNLLAKLKDEGRICCPARGLYVSSDSDDSGDNVRREVSEAARSPVTALNLGKEKLVTDDTYSHLPKTVVTNPMTSNNSVQDAKVHKPVIDVTELAIAKEYPPEVTELYHLWKMGDLNDKALKLPGRMYSNLQLGIAPYFAKPKLTAAEKADLIEIAQVVQGERVCA